MSAKNERPLKIEPTIDAVIAALESRKDSIEEVIANGRSRNYGYALALMGVINAMIGLDENKNGALALLVSECDSQPPEIIGFCMSSLYKGEDA